MPKILEVQMVNWGPLRPDPIPLLGEGVNVATGPNGSGKTCFLDGVKLLLGVDDLGAGRTPSRYIFDGGPDGAPADRAYLRATFANPVGRDQRHRVFAWAGHGCEDAPQVTVVCVVTGTGRWYVVLPGRIVWGTDGSLLSEGISHIDDLPRSRRRGPRQYDELLDRAGVTRALRSVLALPQGATDQIVQRSPSGMLRSLLELTGKQATLDEFKSQREQYETARAAYTQTLEKFRGEETHLKFLEAQARQHREWMDLTERLRRTRDIIAPAARFRDLDQQHLELSDEVERRRKAVVEDEATLDRLGRQLPELETSREEAATNLSTVEQRRDRLGERVSGLRHAIGVDTETIRRLTTEQDGLETLAEGQDREGAIRMVSDRQTIFREATRSLDRLSDTRDSLQTEIASLRDGRQVPPTDLAEMRRLLNDASIPFDVVAESIDIGEGAAEEKGRLVEAALGDALWAVVVKPDDLEEAMRLAVTAGLRVPVAVAGGDVSPELALAGLKHPSHLRLENLLRQLDVAVVEGPIREVEGVSADGVRWSAALARLSAPPTPVLGRSAREKRLSAALTELEEVEDKIASGEMRLTEAEETLDTAKAVLEAVERLPALAVDLEKAVQSLRRDEEEVARADESYAESDRELRSLVKEEADLAASIISAQQEQKEITERLNETRRPQLAQTTDRLRRVEAELGEMDLTEEQKLALDRGEVAATEAVEQRINDLSDDVADLGRFPTDIRDEVILEQVEGQREVVEHVDTLVSGRKEDLDRQQQLVEEARRRYDEHVRAVVRLLNTSFQKMCHAAGVDGELRMIPGELPNEYGVDVRVAHRVGEARRSYRDPGHSGGQRAKIAILILLAAMGVGGSADMLIMDEHIAHLDSTNIDHIAQLMQSLSGQVQFLLATPTNAESLRLGWCDLQLAFLPRRPQDAYTPHLRVMTRLSADDLDRRFTDDQLTLT